MCDYGLSLIRCWYPCVSLRRCWREMRVFIQGWSVMQATKYYDYSPEMSIKKDWRADGIRKEAI